MSNRWLWLVVPLLLGTALQAEELPRAAVLRRTVETDDGARFTVHRYRPLGGGAKRTPVLLVPDLGFRRDVFDLDGQGLAPWLQARGFDVYVIEWAGDRSLAQLTREDLPRALAVIAEVREGPVDLVVHGYAGTLALAASAVELQGRVGRVVALATPVEPEIPNPTAHALLARGGKLTSLALDPAGAQAFDLLFARHGLFKRRTLVELRATAVCDLGDRTARELLAWMQHGTLAFDGAEDSLKARLERYDRPTLLLLGLRDNWAHPEFATPLRELAPRAPLTVRLLSTVSYDEEDYTHLSLLMGAHAPKDVWTPILRFLEEAAR